MDKRDIGDLYLIGNMTKEELLEKAKYLLIECEEWIPILIDLSDFSVVNWPKEATHIVYMDTKIVDSGVYTLLDSNRNVLSIYEGYVPDMLPNEWGDYLSLTIESGIIINMYKVTVDEWLKNN